MKRILIRLILNFAFFLVLVLVAPRLIMWIGTSEAAGKAMGNFLLGDDLPSASRTASTIRATVSANSNQLTTGTLRRNTPSRDSHLPPPQRSSTPMPTPTPALVTDRKLVHILLGEEHTGQTWRIKILRGVESISFTPDVPNPTTSYARSDNKFIVLLTEITNVSGRNVYWESPFILVDDFERT